MKRLLLLLLVLALSAVAWITYELHRPFRGTSGSLILELDPGTSAIQAAQLLADRGIIAFRVPFLVRYALGRPRTLKAGEYMFNRPLRPLDVYWKLVRGEVYLHSVTIPEGSDRFDMARILHNRLGIDPQDFLRASGDGAAIQDLDPQAATLEGYLFPDTYFFPRGVTAETVIGTMLGQFRAVLKTRIPPEIQPSPEEMRDVITLASLVEKETPLAEERSIVAGVFERRLKKRMPLQCDPTVIYAARLEGRPIGPILKSDLRIDSPYNTYRYPGLPPGPIASPGEASIRAALQPEPTEFLYFVSNNQGGHFFSKTLAEHQRRVARYRGEVAALRAASRKGTERVSPSGQHENKPVNSSSESAEEPQQETAHPRSQPGEGTGARGGAGDTRNSGGPRAAPRP
jgi:UPF0755 protein